MLLALFLLAVASGFGLRNRETWKSLGEWVRCNRRMIILVEALFFLSFAGWAFVRASNPGIQTAGGEKTMELAFINAILRSPTFPPHDPWLSGYAISYYYFGYVMAAMLAKATGTLGSVAHNLMSALIYSLTAIGAYGILYNLLAAWRKHHLQLPGNCRQLVCRCLFHSSCSSLETWKVFWKFFIVGVPSGNGILTAARYHPSGNG